MLHDALHCPVLRMLVSVDQTEVRSIAYDLVCRFAVSVSILDVLQLDLACKGIIALELVGIDLSNVHCCVLSCPETKLHEAFGHDLELTDIASSLSVIVRNKSCEAQAWDNVKIERCCYHGACHHRTWISLHQLWVRVDRADYRCKKLRSFGSKHFLESCDHLRRSGHRYYCGNRLLGQVD